jgi:hypothetical protein
MQPELPKAADFGELGFILSIRPGKEPTYLAVRDSGSVRIELTGKNLHALYRTALDLHYAVRSN